MLAYMRLMGKMWANVLRYSRRAAICASSYQSHDMDNHDPVCYYTLTVPENSQTRRIYAGRMQNALRMSGYNCSGVLARLVISAP